MSQESPALDFGNSFRSASGFGYNEAYRKWNAVADGVKPAQRETVMELSEVFKCPECSGELRYNIAEQRLVCSFCSKRFTPEEYENAVSGAASQESSSSGPEQAKFTACPHCGCRISRGALRASANCPVCFEPLNAANPPRNSDLPPEPDFILPFLLDREGFVRNFQKRLRERDFVPDSFIKTAAAPLQALYVPFYLFDASMSGSAAYRAEQITYIPGGRGPGSYRHTVLEGHAAGEQYYFNVPASAAGSLEPAITQSLEPFFCEDARPFSKAYGAGLHAQVLENSRQDGYREARGRITASFDRFLSKAELYTLIKVNSSDYHEVPEKVSYAWFPVWFMECIWQGQPWRIYMNGQTGKVTGSVPVSSGKLYAWGASLLLFSGGLTFWLVLVFLKLNDMMAVGLGAFMGGTFLNPLLAFFPALRRLFATKLRAGITLGLVSCFALACYAGTMLQSYVKTESIAVCLVVQVLMGIFSLPVSLMLSRRRTFSSSSAKERQECDEYAVPSRNVLHEREVKTLFNKTTGKRDSLIDENR